MIWEILISFFVLILSCVVIPLSLWYYKFIKINRYLKDVPGPKPLPLLGSALLFPSTDAVLPVLSRMSKKHGPIMKMMIGFDSFVFICDYKILEFLLSSNKVIKKSKPYTYMHNWLGQGLLTSTGEKWRKRRKVITPAFHFKILEQFVDVFDSASNILVQQLQKEIEKGSTDIYPYITLCALDIICETAMGTLVDAQRNQESEYVRSVKQMCRIVIERGFSAFQQNDFFYKFTENYKTEKQALNILHSYTNSVIQRRRQELLLEAAKAKDTSEDDVGQKRKMAFLDLLLQSNIDGKPLSDEDIREEVDTFMFEGHDTTTSAISFCLFNLAQYPQIQERVLKEQRDIFGADRDQMATYNNLQEMRYLEMVIKETLRMYPSVPFYARQLTEDVQINDKLTIPKGTNVNILAFVIQRNPEFFENPEVFDPERFNAENVLTKQIYSYLPFSAGPRNCIGQKFAMLEMKSSVSKVLRNFELQPVIPEHKLQLLAEAILKSSNGMIVKLVKRNW